MVSGSFLAGWGVGPPAAAASCCAAAVAAPSSRPRYASTAYMAVG